MLSFSPVARHRANTLADRFQQSESFVCFLGGRWYCVVIVVIVVRVGVRVHIRVRFVVRFIVSTVVVIITISVVIALFSPLLLVGIVPVGTDVSVDDVTANDDNRSAVSDGRGSITSP